MTDTGGEQRRMGLFMQLAAWISLLFLLFLFFGERLDEQRNPNQELVSRVDQDGVREVVLKRNRLGHYLAPGTINGSEVVFLVDTGATGIAIPAHIAATMDLPQGRPVMTNTANGPSRSFLTRLSEVRIGELGLYDVDATITPGLQMSEVLLGMSFLKHVEFTQRGNTLTLRQYPDA
jgi:aspartyl protease family protein